MKEGSMLALNSERSTNHIEKMVAALKLGRPYQREVLAKYISNTKETLGKARSAFPKDKEECLEQIVQVTSDYNDAAIVTEQLKKELELEYARARNIRKISQEETPPGGKVRRSSSVLGEGEALNRSASCQNLKLDTATLEAVQEAESVASEPKARIRFKDLVNKVRADRRKSCI
ncbi:hypothetical protein ACHWQZ_G018411 [Mnemiopsis leidyi]